MIVCYYTIRPNHKIDYQKFENGPSNDVNNKAWKCLHMKICKLFPTQYHKFENPILDDDE